MEQVAVQEVIVQNSSDYDKICYEKGSGVAWKIAPHQVRPFPLKIAEQIIEENPKYVSRWHDSAIPNLAEDKVWLANISGNPFFPTTIYREAKDPGAPPIELANPKCVPEVLVFDWNPGQIVVKDATLGDAAYAQIPIDIKLLPGRRYLVPLSIASMITQRDGLQGPERAGRVIRCKAPHDFEPNTTWTLPDIYLYANMLDGQYFNKETLKVKFHAEENLNEDPRRLEDAKLEILSYINYRLLDDQFNPPTREAFDRRKADMAEKARAAATGGARK